jgi:hypothetical protein
MAMKLPTHGRYDYSPIVASLRDGRSLRERLLRMTPLFVTIFV